MLSGPSNPTFICPTCAARLIADETTMDLVCKIHGAIKIDEFGIYRFSEDQTYFEGHWTNNQSLGASSQKMSVAAHFLKPALDSSSNWLDIGTGDGIHLDVLRQSNVAQTIVGLDVSHSALVTCRQRHSDTILLQADAQKLPLDDAQFDRVISFGVLAYLDDPWKGLSEMVRVTRVGGWVGIWIYPDPAGVLGMLFKLARSITCRLPSPLQARVADIIVPFLGLLPTKSGLSLKSASWAACREVALVNIAPPHLFFPSSSEVLSKLKALNCDIEFEDADNPITVWARRRV